jgi:hypothetical protein
MSPRRLTILTVGDGDLSCSLAILRAYGNPPASHDADTHNSIILQQLVATTLISCQEELFDTYEPSQRILAELLRESSSPWLSQGEEESSVACRVQVFYGIDATRLHTYPSLSTRKFDVILFHHPHLGYKKNNNNKKDGNIECSRNDSALPQTVDKEDDDDDNQHAMNHSCLLAHYFDSAQKLLAMNGSIHVCLCSSAVYRWKLDGIAQRLNLKYVFDSPRPASSPLLDFLLLGDADKSTTGVIGLDQQSPKHRLGGSRKGHWLGKYGYRHQPTSPQVNHFKTNVSNSYHYFLQPRERRLGGSDDHDSCKSSTNDNGGHHCAICKQTFDDLSALQDHTLAPALPSNPT